MANDSKLGMLAGLAAVLVVAVVYYQKLPTSANATTVPGAKAKMTPRPASVDPILFPDKPAPQKDVLLRSGGEE